MSKQTINIGASPNDGTGTPLRTSFDYTNQNFTELYTALGGGVGLPGATTQVIFNDGGTNLAGDAGLVYNKTTDALTVAGLVTAGSATITGDLTVDTSTLKVDSANNQVGIGTATPSSLLALNQASGAYSLNMDGGGYGTIASFGIVNVGVDNNSYIGSVGNNDFLIKVANSTRATFDQNGHFNLANGNVVMTTSGKGIDFSAVTGGTGTATANVLNDYEEGTWTPVVTSVTGALTSVTSQAGAYTKIGRMVTATGFFTITTNGSGGSAVAVAGLPFANGNLNNIGVGRVDGTTGNMFQVKITIGAATAIIWTYDNSYPGADGAQFPMTLVYYV